jgi:aspartyl-tRNA(Asn)/glutamyl-tRNA(Gln) amidotransferase subunit B
MVKGMIGLEIHVYLTTKEKLFCRCKASREKGQKMNIYLCPICTGQPGAKPMLPNKSAVEKAVQIGLMLGCKINKKMEWQRKHYDWPDLPKGYQTTISGAHADSLGVKGKFFGIGISSMHLEEDPAAWNPKNGCVDFNRSGLPLVEIVTEPEFAFSEEVVEWLKKLTQSLSYLKVADRNAGIKADVNVSIPGKTERVEVKNVNSIDSVKRAIEYELKRQSKEGSVRETRRFDEVKGKTMSMRLKEEEEDYRFISDPDLQSITLSVGFVKELKSKLPESPDEKLRKMIRKLKIDKKNAEVLTKNLDIAEFFESVVDKGRGKGITPSFALPWVTIELLRVLNWNKKELLEVEIKAVDFVKLLKMVKSGAITELQGKQILNKFVPKSFDPAKTEGKISDERSLGRVVKKVMEKNKKAVSDFRGGDGRAFNYLMGAIMNETNRRADFVVARKILEKALK